MRFNSSHTAGHANSKFGTIDHHPGVSAIGSLRRRDDVSIKGNFSKMGFFDGEKSF